MTVDTALMTQHWSGQKCKCSWTWKSNQYKHVFSFISSVFSLHKCKLSLFFFMAYYFIKHIQIYQLYIPTKRVTIQNFYHDTYRDILDKWRYVLWHFVYLCVRRHFFLLRICDIRPWKLKLIFEKKTTIFM
jgi:hypothetical protein